MDLDNYTIVTDDHAHYEFLSQGPKGAIRKMIRFQHLTGLLYNLAFGDWDERNGKIDDKVRSNNNDMSKVLATVASAVIDFMWHHPNAVVYATGTTPARTRLYQMGIRRHWTAVNSLYTVKGITGGATVPFEPDRNYDAFVLVAKENG